MDTMLKELRQEAGTTKRLLDRIPENEFKWRHHPKSMFLGQLALHVANIPGDLTQLAQLDQFDAANANFEPAMPESKEVVMTAFRTSILAASEFLAALAPDAAGAAWRLTLRRTEVFSMPRGVMLRSLLLNHLVSSSRSIVGLFALAGCPSSRDLWPQRGRESFRLRPS